MRFTSFSLVALATLSIASPIAVERDIVARDVAQVTAAIQNIQTKIAALSTVLNNAAPGKFITALTALGKTSDVNNAVDAATKITKAQTVLTLDDATPLLSVAVGLVTSLTDLTTLLVSKKAAFQNVFGFGGDFTPIIKFTLQVSKTKALQFATALVAILPSEVQTPAQNVVTQVGTLFDNAITQFS